MNRIFFVAGIVLLLFLLGIFILFHGGGEKPVSTVPKVMPLPDYSDTNADVSMTIDGNVNGQDIHRQIVITVDQFSRRLDIVKGYNGNIISTKTFSNSENAYNVFLTSIGNAGFLAENKKAKIKNDTGQCPLGFKYIFELNDGGEQLSSLWTTTCGKIGTLNGNTSVLQNLFKAQITDYNELVSDVNLSAR